VSKTAASLDVLIGIIRESKDSSLVRAALMDLGYQKAPEAFSILLEKINDPNPAIQHSAVVSLGRFGRAEAIEELIKPKIFHSSTSNIRWAAVAAISRLGDYRVIEHLIKAVEDPEWIVRTQAATGLKEKVQEILARKDVKLARILIRMLSLENEEIVTLAMDGFREIGRSALPWLHEALKNPSPVIRANAARTLGQLKSAASVSPLLERLEDEDAGTRAGAAEALGLIGDKSALEPLILKIGDFVEKVHESAAEAIVRFGSAATIPLLNSLSRERNKFALRLLLKCLGRIGDPKVVPALIVSLRSSYFIVRQAAVSALMRFGPSVTDPILQTLSYNTSDIAGLSRDACDKERPEIQMRAVKALGGLEDHRAVALLKELVASGSPDIQEAATAALFQIGCAAWGRSSAIKVLAEIGAATHIPRLELSLSDHSDNVRLEAVRALAKWGGLEAVRHLLRLARKDPRDFIRTEALRSLRTIGLGQAGVQETALRGLKDKSWEVRCQAARLLGGFHDNKSILPLLKSMADPHWIVRESAEIALVNFGREAVQDLTEALKDPRWTTRFRAARLLGEIGDARALDPLNAILARRGERRKVREVAKSALQKLEHIPPA
jgi:HEAT repeat protein